MPIDFNKCAVDYSYYAKALLKIKTKESTLISLSLNEPQQRLHKVIETQIRTGKLARVIVLKARREGISTYCEGRIFWRSHFNENTDSAIIAHEKDSGNNIFNMCKLFYDCLPDQFKPMTRYSSKKEIVFENPDNKTRLVNPGLRSRIEVLTAGKKSVALGSGYHNLHASEVSSWNFADEVIPALIPTIPMTAKSLIVYESTAHGVGNFFHQEWIRAKNGESIFEPFFLSWFDMPEYTRQFITTKERDHFAESLNEEERELMAKHSVSCEQLNWRRMMIAHLRNDEELFKQEYPATDTEAFLVTGVAIFDRRKLWLMASKCTDPTFRGNLSLRGLQPDDHGELKVWEGPKAGLRYVMGVDVADGGQGGDYSCIEVFKLLPAPYIAEQVAEWHGRIDPVNLAQQARLLGMLFNNAMASIEINAHGLVTQQELYRDYWNIYQSIYLDRYDNKMTKKLGWETTERTKKLLIGFMSHCVSDLTVVLHSDGLIQELLTFIRDSNGSAAAASNGHDDRVMASMIAIFTLHQSINGDEALETASTITSPIGKKLMPLPNVVDPEFAYWIKRGQPKDDFDDNWLNY